LSVLRLLLKDDLSLFGAAPRYELGGNVAVHLGSGTYEVSAADEHKLPLLPADDIELEAFFLRVLRNEVPVAARASEETWHEVFHEVVRGIDHTGPFALVVPEAMRHWPMPSGVAEYVCDPEVQGRVYVLPHPCQFLGVLAASYEGRGCALQDVQGFRCIELEWRMTVLDEVLA
jgi:hypothetical protein